jgi:hypothetical protein
MSTLVRSNDAWISAAPIDHHQAGQHKQQLIVEKYLFRASLAVRKAKNASGPVNPLPTRRKNFADAGSGEQQESYGCRCRDGNIA